MQRNEPERRRDPRKTAERDASQPMDGQSPPGDDEDESLQKPDTIPSFLTAQELQVRQPAKSEDREKPATERPPGQKRSGD
jgi:hypothetical protein